MLFKFLFLLCFSVFSYANDNKLYNTTEELFFTIDSYQKNLKINIQNTTNNIEEIDIEKDKFLIKNIIFNITSSKEILNNEYNEEINNLKIKIQANKKNNNKLAIIRDNMLSELYNNRIIYINTINNLKEFYTNYEKKEVITNFIEDSLKLVNENKINLYKEEINKLNLDNNNTNELFIKTNEYYKSAVSELEYIKFTLQYLKNNTNVISRENIIIKKYNFENIISNVDNFEKFRDLNYYIKYYFNTSIGLIIFGIFILILINFSYFIFRVILNKLSLFILKNQKDELKEYVHKLINKHILVLTILFSVDQFIKIVNYKNITYDNSYFQLIYVLYFVFVCYIFLNEFIIIFSEQFFNKYPNIKKEMVAFILKTIKVLLFFLILLIFLSKLGFDIKALLASLGVGGIAVALAAKDTLANLFASIIIMLDNSFSQGDWIVTDKYEGNVVEIRMRTTTIRTIDNALVTIPNVNLANAEIKNMTKRKVGRMIKFSVGVLYESKMEDIKNAIEQIKEFINNNDKIAKDEDNIFHNNNNYLIQMEDAMGIKKDICVSLDSFGEYSINIIIQCFSKDITFKGWNLVKEELLYEVEKIIKNNNLDFAYPTIVNRIIKN